MLLREQSFAHRKDRPLLGYRNRVLFMFLWEQSFAHRKDRVLSGYRNRVLFLGMRPRRICGFLLEQVPTSFQDAA